MDAAALQTQNDLLQQQVKVLTGALQSAQPSLEAARVEITLLRQSRAGPAAPEALRASRSRMVMARLKRALEKLAVGYRPKSPMGQAIGYALNQWPLLERFLEHGEVEIDHNLIENAIRPTAIAKKNWLFFGSEEADRRNAVIYTLIADCRMHGVEPCAYLKDMLERLPTMTNQDQLDQLTPLNWKEARKKSLRQAA